MEREDIERMVGEIMEATAGGRGLSCWESDFLTDIANATELTDAQEEKLQEIHAESCG